MWLAEEGHWIEFGTEMEWPKWVKEVGKLTYNHVTIM